ncbi:hypothetical protein IB289_23070 [Vibrio parahaemolyticus]|uniref:hypothetical protein n=1 Tax=Vibrio parahaemolyticus TaxID=670 RepID=UPI001A234A54|nr:hypothetical protein [Vibrio parahaemolyticus]MCC3859239.1 hypothetical protein [Vibrio parahaemolyticus]HAS3051460.1 hypothetical protein [Vibrio parahaemolyticus]
MKIDINNKNISNLNTQESMRGSEIVKIKQVRQLGLGDLQTGDILFSHDKGSKLTHTAIFFAQLICRLKSIKSASMTHVCLYAGDGRIHEASGLGFIREANIYDKYGLTYEVLRFKDSSFGVDLEKESKIYNTKRNNDKEYGVYSLRGTGGLFRSSFHGKKSRKDLNKLLSGEQFKKLTVAATLAGLRKLLIVNVTV